MTSKTISTSGVDQPLRWLVEFDEMVKPDTWERVRLVVYEKPEGHYADCATPITTQRDIDELTGMPNVYNFLGNKGSGAMNKILTPFENTLFWFCAGGLGLYVLVLIFESKWLVGFDSGTIVLSIFAGSVLFSVLMYGIRRIVKKHQNGTRIK